VNKLIALAAAGLLLSVSVPTVALADPAPPSRLTVTMTDAGFDQAAYTMATTPGSASDTGLLTIVNAGKNAHTATEVPGSPFKVGIGAINFFAGQTSNIADFDTGGLGPGQSMTVGVPFPGTYRFSSAIDCLNGNHSPAFNCTPVTLTVVTPQAGSSPAAVAGTAVIPGGDCARNILTPGTPRLCVGQDRVPGEVAGSPAQPVGDTTVTIDDVTGYQPSVVYLKAGSTITWVNKGAKYHGVKQKTGGGFPDGYHLLDAGLLEPGQSYSYTYACPPGPTSALSGLALAACSELVGPFDYISNIGYDAVPPSQDGFGTTYSSPGSNGSLYTGTVYLVP
jgi:plastocyanin